LVHRASDTETLTQDPAIIRTIDDQALQHIQIPGYELLAELGRGGMGIVYKARQIKADRIVALKMIISGEYAGRGDRNRFRTEAEAAARLQHPNIVQVYEVGEHQGRPFFSQEYCSGGTLAEKLAGIPLPPREAANIAKQLAEAIAAAHAAGVIHRDLKPGNILLDATQAPKIADFGLAKKLDSSDGQTATEAMLGTPSYMSPEQATGASRDVGPTTDVYSLGAILYEMLTGRPPCRGASMAETLDLVRSQEPVAVRRLQPRVPRDLETICLKCLQKTPGRRYTSASNLAEDLQFFLAGQPIRARAIGRLERADKWIRRNPALAASMALVAMALVAGTAVSIFFAMKAEHRAEEANQAAINESKERDRAEQREKDAIRLRNDAVSARNDADLAAVNEGKERSRAELREKEAIKARNDLADKAAALEVQVYKTTVALAYQEWQNLGVRPARSLLNSCPPALKGWEWNFVNRLCNLGKRQRAIPCDPSAEPFAITVRPDGLQVAVGFRDGMLRVYDAETLETVAEIKPFKAPIIEIHFGRRLAYSPDGSVLASALMADTVLLLDGRDPRRELGRLVEPKNILERFVAVTFSPDGKTLATACGQEGIVKSYALKLWSVTDRKLIKTFRGHKNSLNSVAFHPTDGRVATGSFDERVLVWDPKRDEPVHTLGDHQGLVTSVAFSPDGKLLATGCEDSLVRVWDSSSGKLLHRLTGHAGRVSAVAFSPGGDRVASCSFDENLKIWDPLSGRELFTLRGHYAPVLDLAYRKGGTELFAIGAERILRVWDAEKDRQQRIFGDHPAALREGLYSPKGRWIALLSGLSASKQPEIYLYDARSGNRERVISLESKVTTYLPVWCMAFHPQEKLIVTGSAHQKFGEVVACDPVTGAIVWRRQPLKDQVHCVVFAPDGRHVAIGGTNRLAILNAFTGEEVHCLEEPGAGIGSLAYSNDGGLLAAGTLSGPVHLWQTANWKRTHTLLTKLSGWGHSARPIAFHPKGKTIAVAGQNGDIILYDSVTGQEMRRMKGPDGDGCVAFSPDGRRLFSGGRRGQTVKVWDPELGEDLFTIRGLSSRVYALDLSPDGKRLLVTTENFAAHEFDATPLGK